MNVFISNVVDITLDLLFRAIGLHMHLVRSTMFTSKPSVPGVNERPVPFSARLLALETESGILTRAPECGMVIPKLALANHPPSDFWAARLPMSGILGFVQVEWTLG